MKEDLERAVEIRVSRRQVYRVLYAAAIVGAVVFLGFAFVRAIVDPGTASTPTTDVATYFGAAVVLLFVAAGIADPD